MTTFPTCPHPMAGRHCVYTLRYSSSPLYMPLCLPFLFCMHFSHHHATSPRVSCFGRTDLDWDWVHACLWHGWQQQHLVFISSPWPLLLLIVCLCDLGHFFLKLLSLLYHYCLLPSLPTYSLCLTTSLPTYYLHGGQGGTGGRWEGSHTHLPSHRPHSSEEGWFGLCLGFYVSLLPPLSPFCLSSSHTFLLSLSLFATPLPSFFLLHTHAAHTHTRTHFLLKIPFLLPSLLFQFLLGSVVSLPPLYPPFLISSTSTFFSLWILLRFLRFSLFIHVLH